MSDVIVKESKIDGKGVFADRDFTKGEIVTKWNCSKTLTKTEAENASEEDKSYITFVKGRYTLLQPPEKYVNHSCNPNTTVKDFCDVAIRDITKGEEITGDYSEDSPPDFVMQCNCGSKNCRGTIYCSIKKES